MPRLRSVTRQHQRQSARRLGAQHAAATECHYGTNREATVTACLARCIYRAQVDGNPVAVPQLHGTLAILLLPYIRLAKRTRVKGSPCMAAVLRRARSRRAMMWPPRRYAGTVSIVTGSSNVLPPRCSTSPVGITPL